MSEEAIVTDTPATKASTAEENTSAITTEGGSAEPSIAAAAAAAVEETSEVKDEQNLEKDVKDTKAPSRRSTRISSKSQPEAKETFKPKRAPSTKKRAVEDSMEGAKTTKKAKADPSEAGPALGSFLPEITLKSEKEVDVQVSLLAENKGVVLFLVPKADTPGCTNQACGFRDIYAEFTSAEYDVYCVSADPPAAQSKWQEKKSLPYGLLSDPDRKLISALGANDKGKTKRSHFVFAKAEEGAEGKGKLIEKHIGVKPVESPKLALEFIKSYVSGTSAALTGTSNGESIEVEDVATTNGGASGAAGTAPIEKSSEKDSEEAAVVSTDGAEDKDITMEAAEPLVTT
ncbi:thioredoxin-like protein [Lentinula aff. detonsa]|uniref:thioredoxin-dependent peroxiredoxin n=1 Tax=Lentinula aff. detonsa TaxID=2804958 RepID=A0AA38NHM3_9AGAR|nr:thioredoxin-like protein [Lentinula aff. detonsa]